ncbi:MAG TPA: 50S ribosomal protein L11 methyltransferase [Deltaproteobacteria bacterium]|nr:50S ribosomal protein L11 methyltransferase [Deltaproteobacteria bacterium]
MTRNGSEWLEICMDTDPAVHDALSAFLFDLGCNGVVSEDFGKPTLKAYLPFREDLEELKFRIYAYLSDLREMFPGMNPSQILFNRIPDQDWGVQWRAFFHPVEIPPHLLILPAWEPVPEKVPTHVIHIDPGPAFGTGQHATTKLCLKAMEKFPEQTSESWTMLDVGTGSGILAIYGEKLGAEQVVAIDVDPDAIEWAAQNISLNGGSGAIKLSTASIETLEATFPLICANLILSEIVKLIPRFSQLLKPGGYLIVSGILADQVETVNDVLEENKLSCFETLYLEEWACMIVVSK